MLANVVADQFECRLVFTSRYVGITLCGGYSFIGTGASAEIAAYSFSVLSTQLKKARSEYTVTHLKRYRKNKVAAADEFCRGWVYAIRAGNMASAPPPEKTIAISAFVEQRYGKLNQLATSKRELAHEGRSAEHSGNGYAEGRKAKVNTGLQQNQAAFQLTA